MIREAVTHDNATPDFSFHRRILCVFPHYTPSFGTFDYIYQLTEVSAFMVPQGLLVVAAALPKSWEARFVDENIRPATHDDFAWADAVFVTGMHIQRPQILDIARRAHRHDKIAVLGGPSVSAAPDDYPDFDYLHLGEMGDATDQLFASIARDVTRPRSQMVFKTVERRPLGEFPVPAYELAEVDRYMLSSIQFSSGCPYTCEFCDIPGLYGRVPRLKSPEQVIVELDKLLACGASGQIYFVDDNFIANRRAVRELLPHLIEWQKRNGYPLNFACEATLNIAKTPETLALMREAAFDAIFCGIETPEPEALKAIHKDQNMQVPILDAVATINRHGMQVISGIILGLDTDRVDSGDRVIEFVEQSQIPMATINLLQALPRTPLWDRLTKEGRLIRDDPGLESNVRFLLPYDQVVTMWRDCMRRAYAPRALLDRYAHQMKVMWPYRLKRPTSRQRLAPKNIAKGLRILARLLWQVGVRGTYRREFWRFALPLLVRGEVEALLTFALVGHHLIMFARDACDGRRNASNYSAKLQGEAFVAAAE